MQLYLYVRVAGYEFVDPHASDRLVLCKGLYFATPEFGSLHPSDFLSSFNTLLSFPSRIKRHNLVITRFPGFPQIKHGSTTAILL